MSAFTRLFDALWRASKGDGHHVHPSRPGCAGRLRMTDQAYYEQT
jgi:hypothetical protein